MVKFYRPAAGRYKIICEAKAFPSDQYALESQVKFSWLWSCSSHYRSGAKTGRKYDQHRRYCFHDRKNANDVALVLFGGVNYYSGHYLIWQPSRKAAMLLVHTAGLTWHMQRVTYCIATAWMEYNFACWCSYKYPNSGPGGVSGIFIHKNISAIKICRDLQAGGVTKETRFKMEKGFDPSPLPKDGSSVMPCFIHGRTQGFAGYFLNRRVRKTFYQRTAAEWLFIIHPGWDQ